MEHSLVIPEKLYVDFAAYALGQGKTPDQALLDLVREAVEHQEQVETTKQAQANNEVEQPDPIAAFIGAFTFDSSDVAEQHDQYLAEAYADTHEHEQ